MGRRRWGGLSYRRVSGVLTGTETLGSYAPHAVDSAAVHDVDVSFQVWVGTQVLTGPENLCTHGLEVDPRVARAVHSRTGLGARRNSRGLRCRWANVGEAQPRGAPQSAAHHKADQQGGAVEQRGPDESVSAAHAVAGLRGARRWKPEP